MPTEERLDSLLLLWQERHVQGHDLSAAELCRDCPDLEPELRARINALRHLNALLSPAETKGGEPASDPRLSAGTLSQQTVLGSGAGAGPKVPAAPGQPRLPAIPGYDVLEELGRGGMGVVYKARHLELGRLVALKMILAGGHSSSAARARFKTEAEAIARLQHPNIVQVHEVGEHEGKPFFSLELCPGGSLDRKLAGNPQRPAEAARLVEVLARAMQAAHQRQVIHRDLKPGNVLLAEDGTPKITDFGLAKRLDAASQTVSGAVLGTPSYMAPEQADPAQEVGPAADIYALGAILYECLTGRPPFKAATALDTLVQLSRDEPVPVRQLQPRTPHDLETICLKCLHKDPGRRYPTAQALAEDLARFQAGVPVLARPVSSLERGWRWCRRNPAVALSLLAVAGSLLAATVVSVLFGLRAETARRAESARALGEAAAKQEADRARRDVQRQLIDLSGTTGLTAAREQDHSLALLWFARAVQLARDEPEREELNRIRVGNWLRQVSLPAGSFAIPGFQEARDRFRTVEFSPDGNYLLVVASTGACLVWDHRRGRLVSLPEPASRGSAAAWQPGSGQLAVAGKDGQVRFLAPPEFRPAEVLPTGAEITVLAFSKDGRRLAWGGTASARVWDREKKEYATPLLDHGQPVTSLSFSAGGDLLATSARDFKARVFRVAPQAREPLFPPVPHTLGEYMDLRGGPEQVAPRFAAGDQVFLTVERTPQGPFSLVWRSATTGRLLTSYAAPSGQNFQTVFAVSPAGDRVASAVWDGDGRLWDAATQKALASIHVARFRWFEDLTFSADGKALATGGWDRTARLWSTSEWENNQLAPLSPSILHPTSVVRVRHSPDGRHLAAALMDGTIHLWRLPAGPPTAYEVKAGGPTLPALSPDGRAVLPRATSFRNGTQGKTRVYEAETGAAAGAEIDLNGILVDAAFSPDGTRVATASLTAQTPAERNERLFEPEGQSGNVQVWDWKTGRRTVGPIPMPSEPRGLTFRPNGRALAVVCADYQVILADPATGTITHRLDPGVRSRPQNANFWWSNGEARFSPDGRFLVTWELAYAVHVWDPDQGRLLHTLPHHHRIDHVAFNPVAPGLLATSCRDNVVRVWDLNAGTLLVALSHPSHPIFRVRFSPDGTELITNGGDDGILRAWDWRAGRLKDGLALHPWLMTDFGFTADRRWLVTLGMDELQVTDWRTRSPAGPLWKLGRGINLALEIPTGDRRAIVGGFSGSLVGYDLEKMVAPAPAPVADLVQLAELAASRRILEQGNVVPLTSAEWAERWQRLSQTAGSLPSPPPQRNQP